MNTPALGDILYVSRAFYNYRRQSVLEDDLKPAETLFISFIYNHEGCTQEEIVRFSGMDKTTVAHRLSKLENMDYIRRRADSADGRKRQCCLTEKGRAVYPLIHGQYTAFKENVLGSFSEEELAVLEKLIGRLKQNAQKLIEE